MSLKNTKDRGTVTVGILIGIRSTQPRIMSTLSDLGKFPTTRSIARPLCDSQMSFNCCCMQSNERIHFPFKSHSYRVLRTGVAAFYCRAMHAMHKRGLCRHAVSICLSVCLSVCHVRGSCEKINISSHFFHSRVAKPF